MIERTIPASGEKIPAIGLGTWQTFDVEGDREKVALQDVLSIMHTAGGRLIDTSPMYGNAEKVVGELTCAGKSSDDFFYSTKVWTTGKQQGINQMQSSFLKMKRTTMDLIQIHNLTDWQTHLDTLGEPPCKGPPHAQALICK